MPPTFPNPPLHEIRPGTLLTAQQAAAHFGVEVVTIRQWVHRGKIERVALPGGGPHLYHLRPLALAERDAWLNGATRARRGGRHPGWKPCAGTAASAPIEVPERSSALLQRGAPGGSTRMRYPQGP